MSEIAAREPGTPIDGTRAMRRLLVTMTFLGGCTSAAPEVPYEPTLPPGPCAVEGVTGSLPGVTLAIRSESCVYQAGQAARFTYEVATDAALPAIEVPASTGCGSCNGPTIEPLSWTRWRIEGRSSDGADQTYCLCDVGCCPPDRAETIQPVIATVSDVIEWSGRNWYGPSDTNTPEGPAFSPGIYKVKVEFFGYAQGSVIAELPVEIVPAR